jgi:hypothetical protein
MKKPSKAAKALAESYLWVLREPGRLYDIQRAITFLALDIDKLVARRVKQATKKKVKHGKA